jgi:hypothetical protein
MIPKSKKGIKNGHFYATFNISIVLEIMEIIGNIKSSTKFLL